MQEWTTEFCPCACFDSSSFLKLTLRGKVGRVKEQSDAAAGTGLRMYIDRPPEQRFAWFGRSLIFPALWGQSICGGSCDEFAQRTAVRTAVFLEDQIFVSVVRDCVAKGVEECGPPIADGAAAVVSVLRVADIATGDV